ncbi:MAG: hypothetical protein ACYCV0_07355 [Desulfitobacteriaceae bacterium]
MEVTLDMERGDTEELLTAKESWQGRLEEAQAGFSGLSPGARIGVISHKTMAANNGQLLVWEVHDGGMQAEVMRFNGFGGGGTDLLFIADDEVISPLLEGEQGLLTEMKQGLRAGQILFYALKSQGQLLDLGYEELLETVGLPFQGACR